MYWKLLHFYKALKYCKSKAEVKDVYNFENLKYGTAQWKIAGNCQVIQPFLKVMVDHINWSSWWEQR